MRTLRRETLSQKTDIENRTSIMNVL